MSISGSEISVRFGYPITGKNPKGLPLPTQKKFHNSKVKYRLLAGGFGTGKTTSLCLEVIYELLKFPNNYGLLGRKELPELKSTTLKELLDILPPELIYDHNKQDRYIKLINKSELYYMNLDDARAAVNKITSLNLGFAAIDQLEEINEEVFLAIRGRLRRENSHRNFFATCNPAGHDWIYNRWKLNPTKNYELFEATTLENIYLPEDYILDLLSYPEKWIKRYVYCSWDDFEGLVYDEFTEALHTFDGDYEPNENDTHIHVLDYGFRNPTCILFAATDYDGITRIYDEYYQSETLIEDIAMGYRKNPFWEKAIRIADPSIHRVERDGNNVAGEFDRFGVYWDRADNDVRQGINRVNQLFKNGKLLIHRRCRNLLREIGNYKWKSIKPGQMRNEYEEPIKKDDHAMDCLRYIANYLSIPHRPPVETIPEHLKRKISKMREAALTAMSV